MPLSRHFLFALSLALACVDGGETTTTDGSSGGDGSRCGPDKGIVVEVIDGDTITLHTGEKIRYLMVNTPEITNGKMECYGIEARDFNAEYVFGKEVELTYDVECKDAYDRLLAYVEVPDGELNTLLVARGYGCVLNIPPNGEDRAAEFDALQRTAREQKMGLWGVCTGVCGL